MTRTCHAEHTVDHGHEISTFLHPLELTVSRYIRIIHRAWAIKTWHFIFVKIFADY